MSYGPPTDWNCRQYLIALGMEGLRSHYTPRMPKEWFWDIETDYWIDWGL